MQLFRLGCVLAAVGLLAGCGGKSDPTPPAKATAAATTAATPAASATPVPTETRNQVPPLSSADDQVACASFEQAVQAVSALVSHTTEGLTQALHADELAKKTETARASLLDSAKLVALVHPPKALLDEQQSLEDALRMFAADFGRATASTKNGDVNKAAAQTVDAKALRKMQVAVKSIDDLCGD
jgi:hypothetical protein